MIYLDFHSTTPCDPKVVESMYPFFTDNFGNPASAIHKFGKQADKAIYMARKQVSELIGAESREIIFTSGATESNNLTVIGLANGNQTNRNKIITSRLEHKSVSEPIKYLLKFGYQLEYLENDSNGLVYTDSAKDKIDENTLLVSIQYANNEIGTIQNIYEIANISHSKGAFFHTDATQAIGKTSVNVSDLEIDFLSFSSHKIYGPKGVGALFIRGGKKSMPIKPIMFGGGQEDELRPGTSNVAGIVGMGEACCISKMTLPTEPLFLRSLRDYFEEQLIEKLPGIKINGAINQRIPNNSSITLANMDSEILIMNLPGLAMSNGSACNTGALEPSPVLLAIGLSPEQANQTFRIGIGRFTTKEDLEIASNKIINFVNQY